MPSTELPVETKWLTKLTPELFREMPIFSGASINLSTAELHPSYCADADVTELNLATRPENVLLRRGIRKIGQLLCTPSGELVSPVKSSEKTLERIQRELRKYLLADGRMPAFDAESAIMHTRQLTPASLRRLPLFSGLALPISPDQLHPSYRPTAGIQEIELSARAAGLLQGLGIETVGHLLTTRPQDLLPHPNCGDITIKNLHESVREYLLLANGFKATGIDYSSFHTMVRCYLGKVVESTKSAELVQARLGWVEDEPPRTLGFLAHKYGVTGERVRQIARDKLAKMTIPSNLLLLAPFWQAVIDLRKNQENVNLGELSQMLMARFQWPRPPEEHSLEQLLRLNPSLTIIGAHSSIIEEQEQSGGAPENLPENQQASEHAPPEDSVKPDVDAFRQVPKTRDQQDPVTETIRQLSTPQLIRALRAAENRLKRLKAEKERLLGRLWAIEVEIARIKG